LISSATRPHIKNVAVAKDEWSAEVDQVVPFRALLVSPTFRFLIRPHSSLWEKWTSLNAPTNVFRWYVAVIFAPGLVISILTPKPIFYGPIKAVTLLLLLSVVTVRRHAERYWYSTSVTLSVRPSVHPSNAGIRNDCTVPVIKLSYHLVGPYRSCSFEFWAHYKISIGNSLSESVKYTRQEKFAFFDWNHHLSRKRYKIGPARGHWSHSTWSIRISFDDVEYTERRDARWPFFGGLYVRWYLLT